MLRVLFVCTGNTCRSPMAAALFNKKAAEAGIGGEVVAESAGLFAGGEPATAETREVLRLRGINLEGHRSRSVDFRLLAGVGLVLAMTSAHAGRLRSMFPGLADRVFVFGEYVARLDGVGSERGSTFGSTGSSDISDPYGMSLAEYERMAGTIEGLVDRLVSVLLDKRKKHSGARLP